MAPKVRTVGRALSASADWEIQNLYEALAANKVAYPHSSFSRSLSGPSVEAGMHRFVFSLLYCVDQHGAPKLDKDIGVVICRTDRAGGPVFTKMTWAFRPCMPPAKDVVLAEDAYIALNRQEVLECRVPLHLATVLDPLKGWLHAGVLRCSCTVAIVADPERVEAAASVQRDGLADLRDSWKSLLESQDLTDLTLTVRDECLRVHSVVLAARSPVFRAMLSAGMRESCAREVRIDGLGFSAVKDLISYYYTGEVRADVLKNDDSTLGLLTAAHRYEAAFLVEQCVAALTARLCVESVSARLEMADVFDFRSFKEQCLDFMRAHVVEVQATLSYQRLVERRPALLRDLVAAMAAPQNKRRRVG